jgi:hypothetical protein
LRDRGKFFLIVAWHLDCAGNAWIHRLMARRSLRRVDWNLFSRAHIWT